MVRPLALIGSAIAWGSGRLAGEDGPDALRAAGLAEALTAADSVAGWTDTVRAVPSLAAGRPAEPAQALPWITDHNRRLADRVADAVRMGRTPVTIGGDHCGAIGHYAGLRRGGQSRIGVLWIDAHPDLNTPETSPSQAVHGMGLAVALGGGYPELTAIGAGLPAIDPANVVLIGARSIDPGEQAFIDRAGIRHFGMEEIGRRGLAAVLEEAVARASDGTDGFGLTVDLDAIDPADAPGVAVSEPGGLDAGECLSALAGLGRDPRFLGLDLAEYSPSHDDSDGRTARLAIALARALFI